MTDVQARIQGRVKWFDVTRGFGFIESDEASGDVLLHANVLRNYGVGSIAEGAQVEFVLQETDRGLQASELLSIALDDTQSENGMDELNLIPAEKLANVQFAPARVKWFNRAKGFGFANAFGGRDDIFIHAEVVRRSGLMTLQPGEAVALKVVEGPRGAMAAVLSPWDYEG